MAITKSNLEYLWSIVIKPLNIRSFFCLFALAQVGAIEINMVDFQLTPAPHPTWAGLFLLYVCFFCSNIELSWPCSIHYFALTFSLFTLRFAFDWSKENKWMKRYRGEIKWNIFFLKIWFDGCKTAAAAANKNETPTVVKCQRNHLTIKKKDTVRFNRAKKELPACFNAGGVWTRHKNLEIVYMSFSCLDCARVILDVI